MVTVAFPQKSSSPRWRALKDPEIARVFESEPGMIGDRQVILGEDVLRGRITHKLCMVICRCDPVVVLVNDEAKDRWVGAWAWEGAGPAIRSSKDPRVVKLANWLARGRGWD